MGSEYLWLLLGEKGFGNDMGILGRNHTHTHRHAHEFSFELTQKHLMNDIDDGKWSKGPHVDLSHVSMRITSVAGLGVKLSD